MVRRDARAGLAVRRFGVRWPYAAAAAVLLPLCLGSCRPRARSPTMHPPRCAERSPHCWPGATTGRIDGRTHRHPFRHRNQLNAPPMFLLAGVLVACRQPLASRSAGVRSATTSPGIGGSFTWCSRGGRCSRLDAVWAGGSPHPRAVRPVGGNPLDELLSTTFSGFQLGRLPAAATERRVDQQGRCRRLVVAAPFAAISAFPSRPPGWATE
jgi:hypothetical protein